LLAPLSLPSHEVDGWQARLGLHFRAQGARTDLRHRHQGPLRIQKALYPEGPECCHAIIVHPPGGIAAGDCLHIEAQVDAGTHAVVSTPSATKWYGAYGQDHASQTIDIQLQGRLEWLPAESIIFNRAQVQSRLQIIAGNDASMIGWDQLVFGRQASDETYASGWFDQCLRFQIEQQCVWVDRLRLHGDDALFDSPIGLNGHRACALLWALAPAHAPWAQEDIDALRSEQGSLAWTLVHPRLLVARMLGAAIDLGAPLQLARQALRLRCWGMPSPPLRLWAT